MSPDSVLHMLCLLYTSYGAMAVGSAVTDRIHTTGPDFGRTPLATDWEIGRAHV